MAQLQDSAQRHAQAREDDRAKRLRAMGHPPAR